MSSSSDCPSRLYSSRVRFPKELPLVTVSRTHALFLLRTIVPTVVWLVPMTSLNPSSRVAMFATLTQHLPCALAGHGGYKYEKVGMGSVGLMKLMV